MNENTEDLNSLVNFAGQDVTMAQLGDIDMAGVDAVRFENLPQGCYVFETIKASRGTMDVVDKKTQETITRAVINIDLVVAECRALLKMTSDVDLEDFKGKTHTEMFFLGDATGVGRFKAYMEDSKFTGTGKLDEVLAAMKGHAFVANIIHKKNAKDPDNPYANIVFPKEQHAA